MGGSATRYVHARDALSRRLPDRVLVLRQGGDVQTLTGTAADVWDLLRAPIDVPSIVEALQDLYVGSHDEVARDVHALVRRLAAVGAVEPSGGDR